MGNKQGGKGETGGAFDYTKEFNVVLVGQPAVGKSSLVIRYIAGQFVTEYDPTIEDSYRKQIEIDGRIILFNILDTAGPEEYSSMITKTLGYAKADAFLLCVSANSATSLELLSSYVEIILRTQDIDKSHLIAVIAICKTDILAADRSLDTEKVEAYAKTLGIPVVQTSAKENLGVSEVFAELVRQHIQKHAPARPVFTAKK
eukprot:TRINITY_DN6551_c0_g2_i1.p1 TRINITY_DN6551_c0_g2~~TRINITY_DN6551_c0_g2_i1.p1  ORF type:complete len:202 (-),score=18.76 TRINITY_DN6551_c0_g2_i1:23-628(-)